MNKTGWTILVIIIIIIAAVTGYVKFGDIKGESDDKTSKADNEPNAASRVDDIRDDLKSAPKGEFLQDGDLGTSDVFGIEEEHTGESGQVNGTKPIPSESQPTTTTISYSDSGFEPADVTISIGNTVTFVSESSLAMWPASDVHPTHTVYPGSDIDKCFDGSDTSTLFDSCGDVESYSFTFTETGSWDYHNHKRASHGGTITVQ